MYGMIHTAAKDMTMTTYGEETWSNVLSACGLTDEHFHKAEQYSDDITLSLIRAISQETGLGLEDLLRSFGRHWIHFVARSSYKSMFDLAGDNLESFLSNLDEMHDSISETMPDASMPSFEVLSINGREVTVRYRSERTGLEPFVYGLLEGLLEHFGETGHVDNTTPDDSGIFVVVRGEEEAA